MSLGCEAFVATLSSADMVCTFGGTMIGNPAFSEHGYRGLGFRVWSHLPKLGFYVEPHEKLS